jgi:transcription initiation factor TFIID subunit TAF12
VNIGAMQSHLQQNMKNAKMKERMHQKLQQRQEQQQQQQQQQQPQQRPATSVYTASSGETIMQTPRVAPQSTTNQLPAQAINDAEKNLVEWAQAHMTPASGSGQKKKKKNKK